LYFIFSADKTRQAERQAQRRDKLRQRERERERWERRQDQKFTANVFLLFLRFAFQMQLLSHPSAMLSAISQCYYNTAIVISSLSSISHFIRFPLFLAKKCV